MFMLEFLSVWASQSTLLMHSTEKYELKDTFDTEKREQVSSKFSIAYQPDYLGNKIG